MRIYNLGSGSSGNCTYFKFDGYEFLVDVGFSYKEIKKRLASIGVDILDIKTIFITHGHSDHNRALQTFKKRNKPISINPPHIGRAFSLNHSVPCKGFTFEVHEIEDEKIGYLTDTGYVPPFAVHALERCSILIVESNHNEEILFTNKYAEDSRMPASIYDNIVSKKGHLSNRQAEELISFVRPKIVALAHLSAHNNNEQQLKHSGHLILQQNEVTKIIDTEEEESI